MKFKPYFLFPICIMLLLGCSSKDEQIEVEKQTCLLDVNGMIIIYKNGYLNGVGCGIRNGWYDVATWEKDSTIFVSAMTPKE